jgi:AraC-like DNA-binding protein
LANNAQTEHLFRLNDAKINSFSYLCIMKKVNFNTPIPQELHLDYHDKYIVLLDNVHQVQHTQETILNESFIIIMIENGECTATINGNEYSLNEGDLLICTPGNVLEHGMVSINFHCRIFIMSSEYAGDILKGTLMSISHYLMSKVVQTIHLSQEEQETIKGYYHLFSTLNPLPEDKIREHIVHHLLKSFAYAFVGFFIQRGYASPRDKGTSAEILFRKFVRILHEHPDGRTVQFYAVKLSITPKYFNTICKQISGKTASKIINEEIVTQAHLMLKDPDLSIKQISSILGFTNQSHFGSFIRKETGVSPQALRKKQL